MQQLWDAADFIRDVKRRLRFGEFSRAPLHLLRFELRPDAIECDWIARTADAWDSTCRDKVRGTRIDAGAGGCNRRAQSRFRCVSQIESAVLRGFRQPAREPPEMIVLGTVSREIPAVHRVSSLAMRAKLYGFCFCFEDGFLRPLQQLSDRSEEFIAYELTQPGQGGIRNGGK